MRVYFHEAFYRVYSRDPAAAAGRMEAVIAAIEKDVTVIPPRAATAPEIETAHHFGHIERIRRKGLFDIAALAAGAAIGAAADGMTAPAFALTRPPGHHAAAASSWGFCCFNNMAVALNHLKQCGLIESAFVLDFDLHYGDGTVNILGKKDWVTILNPETRDREAYLHIVSSALATCTADVIGASAGFDNHRQDWGGLLRTEDYNQMGRWMRKAAKRNGGGCFGVLEGGYNHNVLGEAVAAFLDGLRAPGARAG